MKTFLDDLRYALRSFAKNPGFTAVVLATLALGIGSVVAIFSIANGVLVRPLPYRNSERLVRIGHVRPDTATPKASFSPQDVEDLQAALPGLSGAAAWNYFPNQSSMALTGSGEPIRLPAANVDGRFFETLDMPALAGRFLTRDDDTPGRNHVAVVSAALWKRRFGGDRALIGRPLVLDGTPYEVVGVMPAAFAFPSAEVDVWTPLSNIGEDSVPHKREVRWLNVVGRLAPTATVESARTGLDALLSRLSRQYPESNAGFDRASVLPLSTAVTGDVRTPIWVLLGAVSVVLLIGCVNVANLLLARASARRREIGIRAALGAGRGRLVRQLLTESLSLSLAGGVLGLLLARWGIDALMAFSGGHVPRAAEIQMDSAVVAFALVLSVVTGIAFGLLPALYASRGNLRSALEGGSGGRGGTESRGGLSLRRGLVVGEITLAVTLLVGAGLLLRSFWRLTHADPGFRSDSVLSLSITVPENLYAEEKDQAYRWAMLSMLSNLPGVAAAGASKTLPLHSGGEAYPFSIEGRPELKTYKPDGGAIIVTPGYFSALRIPILKGRDFTTADMESQAPVLLVNRTLARTLWGSADPIGKGMSIGDSRLEVIGLVGDVRVDGLALSPRGAVYVPMSRFPRGTLKFYLRTSGDPLALAASARAAIHRMDPDQAITGLAPLSEVVSDTVARPRFLTLLVGVFGAAALLLAAIGVYGVISFSVARRTREIGVRIALGADRAAVRRLVMREGMSLAAAGLALGTLGALAVSQTLSSVLFETRAQDPLTLVAVGALLLGVALAACAIPARRAANLDPQEALRVEL